ncbi:unnamed protein product [Orchesella dallaii]|uniref:Uncharacterized protein n=1 Tax=Orchesella dallaii TaxID=48710 RepID=A0ABP1RWF9_9HEXA
MGANAILKFIGFLDFWASFIGIPTGTYFVYSYSWWSSLDDFGAASAFIFGMLLSTTMAVASACLFVAGTDSATVNETKRYINIWYGTSLAFTCLTALSGIIFVTLSYQYPWIWATICFGLAVRCSFYFILVRIGIRPTWNKSANTEEWELNAIDI